jgi:phosphoribosylanthranilate isomerase
MKRVRVKVCGLREPEKAAAIARCGADAIGMVFADSPRWVSPEQAREISDALPPFVATVGVFVNAAPVVINRVVEKARLQYIQLHGDEAPELVEQIDRPVIKAFRVRDTGWLAEVRQWLSAVATPWRVAAILLDAYKEGAYGGTGERFNWEWVADARQAKALAGLPPIILSGGLDKNNVVTAMGVVQPWAVDVSSGVEAAPGVKDVEKANRFIITVVDDVPELRSDFWK